jgi:hypothetical protein
VTAGHDEPPPEIHGAPSTILHGGGKTKGAVES